MRHLSHGFSLVEFVVGLAIITIAMLGVGGLSMYLEAQNRVQVVTQCDEMARTSLNRLLAMGSAQGVAGFDPTNGRASRETYQVGGLPSQAIWPGDQEIRAYEQTATGVVLQNFKLLVGSMVFLNSLYNQATDAQGRRYCDNTGIGGSVPTAPNQQPILVAQNILGQMNNTETTLRIERMHLLSDFV